MLISRTPYRISFFGGGTDYPSWFKKHGGCVLSATIDKYAYITARFLPPFFQEKSRIVWSKIEAVGSNADINHPSVRACLKYLQMEEGVEIHHTGDLPARSGLGSSSTFTVGLLNALYALKHKTWMPQLVYEAIHVEQNVMKENVGVQDQISAAFGGFNRTEIFTDGSFLVNKIEKKNLEDYLLLCFTGISRTASEIAAATVQAQNEGAKDRELHKMREMVDEAIAFLDSYHFEDFGRLLHESWLLKRSLAANIAPPLVDDIYARALKAGAIGGKLLGAGGGGFMLFFAKPEDHDRIREELKDLLWVPFMFSSRGSEIIHGL